MELVPKEYCQLAAKKGGMDSRFALGQQEMNNGNKELAVKHFLISAAARGDSSLEQVARAFQMKMISREKYEEVLRAHQESKDEIWSENRELIISGSALPLILRFSTLVEQQMFTI